MKHILLRPVERLHDSYTGIVRMPQTHHCRLNLSNILVATDFSAASVTAALCATSLARRHGAKLFLTHVVSSSSEKAVMDGWRAGQAEVMGHVLADRLDGVQYELLVRSGDVWPVLSKIIHDKDAGLVVVGTRGRTGVRKFVLGSVAESIFRQAPCPVVAVGPNVSSEQAGRDPERILAPTGFAPHSVRGVQYAAKLAEDLGSSLALLNVVTNPNQPAGHAREAIKNQRLTQLHSLVPADLQLASQPQLFVEFGSASDQIIETAAEWHANLIVLGLHGIVESARRETTWTKAYEVVCEAPCPVLILRGTE